MNDQKIALLTDSCADIAPKLLKKYDIFMVPLQIKFSDGDYLDGRHPEKVEFTSAIEEDLLRRDFTVNAMA